VLASARIGAVFMIEASGSLAFLTTGFPEFGMSCTPVIRRFGKQR
jgi:hypothetical protein